MNAAPRPALANPATILELTGASRARRGDNDDVIFSLFG